MDAPSFAEVSYRGKWSTVPAFAFGETKIIVKGRLLKIATIHDEQWLDGELEDPEGCIRSLAAAPDRYGPPADIFTFAQKLPATTPKYDYPMEWESVAAAALPSFDRWWSSLPQETRKNTRRAAKRGVVVTISELNDKLIDDIVKLNNDSPLRQGTPFHHYGKSHEQVRKDQSTHVNRSEFICAYVGDELIGFLKLVYCGPFASLLLLITNDRHQDKRPANALITRAMQRCDERGLSYMVYGKYRYGNQPRTSLMDFKDRNGFKEILVPRFYVPLTVKGTIGTTLGLYRDRVGLLPTSVIAVARRLRAGWYQRSDNVKAGVA